MSVLTQYYKTTATGTDGCRIVEPCCDFCRPTMLPPGWRRTRIMALVSFTDLVGPNSRPPAEQVPNSSQPSARFFFGLSNGLFPGQPGSAYAGMAANMSNPLCIARSGTTTGLGSTVTDTDGGINPYSAICVNGDVTYSSSNTSTASDNFSSPEGPSNWGVAMGVQLDRRVAGQCTMGYEFSGNISKFSRLDMLDLFTRSFDNIHTLTGNTPDDIGYMLIYTPYIKSRLRVHYMGFIQLD